ncbi:protein of unknown function [Pararobbsia alpina]
MTLGGAGRTEVRGIGAPRNARTGASGAVASVEDDASGGVAIDRAAICGAAMDGVAKDEVADDGASGDASLISSVCSSSGGTTDSIG